MSEEIKKDQETLEAEETVQEEGATQEEGQTSEALTEEKVQRMIQSAEDRVRTDYAKRLKELEAEKEALKQERMSEEEKRQYELEKMQKELTEKEQAVKDRELALRTVDLLREYQLPLEFSDFVRGGDEEETTERVKQFKKLFQKTVQEAVEEKFRGSGVDPHKSKDTGSLTREQVEKMSPEEINKNWQAISKMMAEGKL